MSNAVILNAAKEIYVGPNGTPAGSGTRQEPFDIVTAFSGKAGAQAGDTSWLLGGVYDKVELVKATLKGKKKGRPIVVRQAPGERATISGSMEIQGSDIWYWGFEVRGTRGSPNWKNATGLAVLAPRAKFIYLIVYRGPMGYGLVGCTRGGSIR